MTGSITLSADAIKRLQALGGPQSSATWSAFLDGYILAKQEVEDVLSRSELKPLPNVPPHDPPSIPAPVPPPPKREPKFHLRNRGVRGKVLRLLYTGPTTLKELAREFTVAESRAVTNTITNLNRDRLIAYDPHTPALFTLTTAGRQEAKWFVDNPTKLIRNPQAVESLKRQRNGAST